MPVCRCPSPAVCVKKVVTELAALEIVEGGFLVVGKGTGRERGRKQAKTAGRLIVDGDVPEMILN